MHPAVDDEAREADREVSRSRVDLLQRIRRGIDDGRRLRFPHRLEVCHGLAPYGDIDQLGDHLHERRAGGARVSEQLGRRRGCLAHELVLAVEEQHAGLRQLQHRESLRARHHELLIPVADARALRERVDRHTDEADQCRTQGHDREVQEFHVRSRRRRTPASPDR
jgi:hypothetical protein